MHRISLGNTVFEGANNAYLLEGEATVLLDTGVAIDETREELEAGLVAQGVTPADLDAIVLTHYHADHSGLAGELQAESGASVHVHAADAPLVAGDEDAWADFEAIQRSLFDDWGMPDESREELLAYLEAGAEAGIYGDSVDVTPFETGETLSFGDLELEVLHAPGHTAGLCCFVPVGDRFTSEDSKDDEDDKDAVFTGDALLPEYTPNVGGADVRLEQPLQRYVRTLETLIERDFSLAWPGHREPIDDPAARARYILTHHEERAYRVAAALEKYGSANAWTVSARLFGNLENIHILHGPGEAYAHLEHLCHEGAVERERTAGTWRYHLTDDGQEMLGEYDGGRWPLEGSDDPTLTSSRSG